MTMKKIKCKISYSKGYIILDDDTTFLGTIFRWSDSPGESKWRWATQDGNAFGNVDKISDAYPLLRSHK